MNSALRSQRPRLAATKLLQEDVREARVRLLCSHQLGLTTHGKWPRPFTDVIYSGISFITAAE